MSNLIVITFNDPDEAGKVREALHSSQHEGFLSLDDSAVIVKDADGKIHVHNEMDRGVKVGAGGGSLIGMWVGFMFGGPIGGAVVGALAGALTGALAGKGVDKKFVKEVTESLQPNSSAIFVIVRQSNPEMVIAALKPYQGTVHHTTLDPEDEETLKRILSKRM